MKSTKNENSLIMKRPIVTNYGFASQAGQVK